MERDAGRITYLMGEHQNEIRELFFWKTNNSRIFFPSNGTLLINFQCDDFKELIKWSWTGEAQQQEEIFTRNPESDGGAKEKSDLEDLEPERNGLGWDFFSNERP